EDPGVDECAATDRDGVTAREFPHPPRVGNRSHVAVSYDRNLFDRFDNGANSFQINRAAESLGARPAVDRDRGNAELLEFALRGRARIPPAAPPQPHLDRDGNLYTSHPPRDEAAGTVGVAHQSRPTPSARDLGHRAAHIDIDGVVTLILEPLRRIHEMFADAA